MTATEITREQIETAEGEELNRFCELLVFGDDLTARTSSNNPRLMDAVNNSRSWDNSDVDDILIAMRVNEPSSVALWRLRGNRRYREQLERDVANWRAKPRDFVGDGNAERELKAELRERFGGLSYQYIEGKPGSYHEYDVGAFVSKGCGVGADEPTALCRAACLACLEQRKG